MMDGRLRILAPQPMQSARARPSATGLFWCSVVAIVIQFILSHNVLKALGYNGNMHPAAIFPAICVVYGVASGIIPLHRRLLDAPGLVAFVFGIPVVMLYSICFNGLSGCTVFIESFWSAGLLALMLEPATAKQKRLLGGILIALVAANACIGLFESLTQTELFPLTFDPDAADTSNELVEDFRAHAFFDHPLTASLQTAMAIFLLYSMRMRLVLAVPVFGLMLMGLLAYGGRTALAVTVIVSIAMAIYGLLAGLVKRKFRSDFLVAIGLASVVIPLAVAVVVTQTTIADRIIHTLYYDDSAEVRATQWDVFKYLSLKDWLFGISKDQLAALKYQIGLGGKDTDIENFWILIFFDLGALGFALFLTIFFGFLAHLGRYAKSLNGWVLIGSALLINSTFNSLGVWSNAMFIETAFVIAMAGFNGYEPVPRRFRAARALPALQQFRGKARSLALIASPLNEPNLRGGKLLR
jgi:hypothetical protein